MRESLGYNSHVFLTIQNGTNFLTRSLLINWTKAYVIETTRMNNFRFSLSLFKPHTFQNIYKEEKLKEKQKSIANNNFDVDIKFRSFFVKSTGYQIRPCIFARMLSMRQYCWKSNSVCVPSMIFTILSISKLWVAWAISLMLWIKRVKLFENRFCYRITTSYWSEVRLHCDTHKSIERFTLQQS